MPLPPRTQRNGLDNTLRHAVGIIALAVVLGAAYVTVSILGHLASAALRAAL